MGRRATAFKENTGNAFILLIEVVALFTVGYALIITFLPYLQYMAWIAAVLIFSFVAADHVDGEAVMQNMDEFLGRTSPGHGMKTGFDRIGGEVQLVEVIDE